MQDVLPLINGNCEFMTVDGRAHSIKGKWDLLIAHPPCTYLTNAGARWLYASGELNTERYKKGLEAKKFFMNFINADCERIAVENPIPSSVYCLPAYSQIVQPYEHGHPHTKKTCLWLKGLNKLEPSNIVEPIKGKKFQQKTGNGGILVGRWIKKAERKEPEKEVRLLRALQELWLNSGGRYENKFYNSRETAG